MKIDGRPYRTIWLADDGWSVEIIDQTRLPHDFAIARLATVEEAAHAIRAMLVRGAPLIGAVAAYGLALALRREPRLAERLGPVAIMGGARSEGGNITPSAEFNIWADPEAAAVVFASGCGVVAFGLDATHQVRATEARIRTIEAAGSESARTAASMLRFSQRIEREIVGWEAAPLHDACPIAWLMRPDLFELRPCRIEVETQSELTRGHTAVEFRVDAATARHHWAVKADGQGVFDLIAATLEAAA